MLAIIFIFMIWVLGMAITAIFVLNIRRFRHRRTLTSGYHHDLMSFWDQNVDPIIVKTPFVFEHDLYTHYLELFGDLNMAIRIFSRCHLKNFFSTLKGSEHCFVLVYSGDSRVHALVPASSHITLVSIPLDVTFTALLEASPGYFSEFASQHEKFQEHIYHYYSRQLLKNMLPDSNNVLIWSPSMSPQLAQLVIHKILTETSWSILHVDGSVDIKHTRYRTAKSDDSSHMLTYFESYRIHIVEMGAPLSFSLAYQSEPYILCETMKHFESYRQQHSGFYVKGLSSFAQVCPFHSLLSQLPKWMKEKPWVERSKTS